MCRTTNKAWGPSSKSWFLTFQLSQHVKESQCTQHTSRPNNRHSKHWIIDNGQWTPKHTWKRLMHSNAWASSFKVHNAHSIKKEHRKHGRRTKGGTKGFTWMKIYRDVESGFLKFLIFNGGDDSLSDGGCHLQLSIYGDVDFDDLIMFLTQFSLHVISWP